MLCLLAQPKLGNNQFKNNKQPELPENITVWKSSNQGVKEETFIQPSRRGREEQLGREDSQQGSGWQTGRSHIHVQINQEEQLGSWTDRETQGSSAEK